MKNWSLILILMFPFASWTQVYPDQSELRYTINRSNNNSAIMVYLKGLNKVDTFSLKRREKHLIPWKYHSAYGLVVLHEEDNEQTINSVGYYQFYYLFGQLKYELILAPDGHKQGIKHEYYRNGNIKTEIDYGINQNNECCNYHGIWYDSKGLIEMEGKMQDGMQVGIWYYYKKGIKDHFIDYTHAPEQIVSCEQ